MCPRIEDLLPEGVRKAILALEAVGLDIPDATPEEIQEFEMARALENAVGYTSQDTEEDFELMEAISNLPTQEMENGFCVGTMANILADELAALFARNVIWPEAVFLVFAIAKQPAVEIVDDVEYNLQRELLRETQQIDLPDEVVDLAKYIAEKNEFSELDKWWRKHQTEPTRR